MEPQESMSADVLGGLFKDSMSRLASGVVMVTCFVGGRPWGLTVSACCSVSAQPPTLLVSLARATASTAAIREQERFGVSILGASELRVALAGSAPGAPKFIEDFCAPSASGPRSPEIAGSLAHLDCDVVETFEVNDHVLFVGRVTVIHGRVATAEVEPPSPLVHYQREFYALASGQALAS